MVPRRLGATGIEVSPIGWGAFKIGRNEGIKYAHGYDLPSDDDVRSLVDGLLALGITCFDTAPAYGTSEARLGDALDGRRADVVLSTKVGETFEDGRSTYDFSGRAARESIARSRDRLRTDVLDIVFIHSNGDDLAIQRDTDLVAELRRQRDEGSARAIGFSGKTVEGARAALEWADAIMVEYHPDDRSHHDVMLEAADRGVGVLVKKALASGRLDPAIAIPFATAHAAVSSVVLGSLTLENMRRNVELATG